MKKIIVSLLIILWSIAVSSQRSEPVQQMTKQDYLQKSKNQKTTGWVLLAGGSAIAVTGLIIASNAKDPEGWFETSSGQDWGFGIMSAGILCDFVSIPFFISSALNARRAATISFKNQQLYLPGNKGTFAKTQPAISLKMVF